MTEWRSITTTTAPAGKPTSPTGKVEAINHPAYYNTGTLEVIDAIEGLGLGTNFHLATAIKYIARAGKKDPDKTEEDIRKAIWYLTRYIEYLEKEQLTHR